MNLRIGTFENIDIRGYKLVYQRFYEGKKTLEKMITKSTQ